jgi:uncharacterized membrane protein YdbT with pleckstrin-like domain
MTYVDRSLHDGESVFYQAKYFWFERYTVYMSYVLGIILIPVVIGVFLIAWAAWTHLKIKCTERAVTNWRVIQKKGIISVNSEEIMMSSIETITIHQSAMERLMGGGTVRVTGRGGIIVDLTDVDDPILLKKNIEHQRMNYGHA